MPRVRFDFPALDAAGPAVYTDAVRVVQAHAPDQVVPALRTVEAMVADGLHAAGFLAYEAAPAFEPAMAVRAGGQLPLLWFGLFRGPEQRPGDREPGHEPRAEADVGAGDHPAVDGWALDTTREGHADAVARIRAAIAEGRTYQVNLTTRLRGRLQGDPEALYHRLRRAQGGGWHALLDLGRHVILSASPELFFRTRGRAITTRPMKGTRPRGRWPEEDRRLAEELASSPKDRAENLMIVDLLRNDLGRICVPGSITVPALRDVERYRTVWQMTSTVTGTLRSDVGLVEILAALFPCGSVTGAPKISTMEVIAGLEDSPREVYCGAIGWIRPGGHRVFSVPIRTAWADRSSGQITYGTGGGVVWDSTPASEYEELLAKTAVVRDPWPAFHLLETLAVVDGRPVRLDRHLARMAASADRFDRPFPGAAIRDAAHRAAAGEMRARLRITLGPDGGVAAETAPPGEVGTHGPTAGGRPDGGPERARSGSAARGAAPETDRGAEPRPVVLAETPVDPGDPFLYHKTTHRAVYDRHLAGAPAHAFDVLLWNVRGQPTELCRGNLVAELDGRLVTPPLEAGLLPGCLRAELLEEGCITEAPLTLQDLSRATGLWFINSARGWIPIRVQDR